MYYFAYGSNMNRGQMKKRCPSAKFLFRAYLENYKLVFDGYSKNWKGAVANIVPEDGSKIWGGLFEINDDNLAALDCYEGYHSKAYDRKELDTKDDNNKIYEAKVYFRLGEKPGDPSEEYLKVIIRGAGDCGLPEEYQEKLKKMPTALK
ncbi:MAG: gamma-glutamylcyclotransferase family protein [Candidatus Falkowbacteria bacterium]